MLTEILMQEGKMGVILRWIQVTNITWATFLGGSGEDAAYTLKVDDQDNVYVAGGTSSSNFPVNTNNTSYGGGNADGFVTKLNSDGTAMINSTFLGTSAYDQAYLLDLDKDFNVYVCGQTRGSYPVIPGPSGFIYSNNNAKQFITKLEPNLSSPIFSTVFGSVNANEPNISPTAMLVDRCGNIYVSGWGGSTNSNAGGNVNGMPITADALDASPGIDASDFYMIVLSRNAESLVYGSYMGGYVAGSAGDHVDGGTSRFDKNGVVYHAVCAGCWGNSSFPAQPSSVWSTTNGANGSTGSANGCNLAIFKMDFDLSGIEADFQPLDTNNVPIVQTQGCAPLTVNFDNTSFVGVNPGPISYFWDFDDGSSSTQFEPTHVFQNAGTYDVMLIITDPTSCNISDTTYRSIIVFPPPTVDAGPDVTLCAGDTITLSSITTGAAYQWSGNGIISPANTSQVSAVGINTGYIYLTLTDVQGCRARDSVLLTVDTSFEVQARNDTIICRGGTTNLGATSNGGVSYFWTSFPTANISNPNLQNPSVTNLDTTTMFYVRSVNAIGCEDLDSVEIEVFEVFTLEDTFVCDGNSIVLLSSNGVSWQWEPDNGSLDNVNIASPTATPQITTTYTVTATSANGCISTKNVLVELEQTCSRCGKTEMCFGGNVNLRAQGGLSYLWTPSTGLSDTTIPNPVATPSVTTTYSVTVFNSSGCQDTDDMTLVVHPLPSVQANEDETICQGESYDLLVTGAVSYVWGPAGTLSNPNIANPVATPSSTTLYIVEGTDMNGCRNRDSVEVEVVPRPITEIDGINQICVGGSIVLTASGGDSYIWSTGETTASISIVPDQPTTYYATAFIGQCEGIPDSLTVDLFFDYPEADFIVEPGPGFSPRVVNFTNLTTGAASYSWDFGFGQGSDEEHPTHDYPVAGQYTITLIAYSGQGCPDTASQTILLENVTLHVPSGFTPNGDGNNDLFLVGYYGIQSLNIRIYSRWGQKIYEASNKDFRWDGRYKGAALPEGVYVYVIDGIGENGLDYERRGTVTLIR
ncbi:MAG: PKD domain-containing protein [Bacteroidia bacterium]